MTVPPEGPTPIALAAQWVSRILTVSLVMIVPGIVGDWLDGRWGTSFLSTLGFAFGLVAGMYHLLVMTGAIKRRRKPTPKRTEQTKDDPS